MSPQPQYKIIASYHEATKHHLNRYARSAGFMDWANQPNPFRLFETAPQVELPFRPQDPDNCFADLFTPPPQSGAALGIESIASFFEFSMGLSAWKRAGDSRWPLRVNPSSGNLHPTEGYLVAPHMPGLSGGLYHYSPLYHSLELRAALTEEVWPRLAGHFGGTGFLVALSSIFWRESWKYGERAFRYCNLDTGHALAALAVSARLHNWHMRCLSAMADSRLQTLLGINQTAWHANEDEVPELICWVSPQPIPSSVTLDLPAGFVDCFADQPYLGRPKPLSAKALDWPIIGQAATATEKQTTPVEPLGMGKKWAGCENPEPAAAVIRKRRSAVCFDPNGYIEDRTLFAILGRTLASLDLPPLDIGLGPPMIDLVLFVHRVRGVDPGLYLLARQNRALDDLRSIYQADFLWRPIDCDLPLWQLSSGDVCQEAATLSCHQDIAGHSTFAVSMLASFDHLLRQAPYRYRHLHWECGMIGQVLYLAAEAHGLRGTGIGCFFDDEVHRLLGLQDQSHQSLYHFTIGHPIEDERVTTLPAYHHIDTTNR